MLYTPGLINGETMRMVSVVFRVLLLGVIWIAVLFVLLQGAGFVYFDVLNIRAVGEQGYPNGLFVAHNELDYLYTPGFQGHFIGGPYHDIAIKINAHGFRDHPFGPPGDRQRLVALGDSVVFGSGVAAGERFTSALEAGAAASEGFEMLNLGVNSYSFAHYVALARMRFLDLEPDLVLVGFTLNDIAAKHESWPARRYGALKSATGSGKPK